MARIVVRRDSQIGKHGGPTAPWCGLQEPIAAIRSHDREGVLLMGLRLPIERH
jgi:hypothetical protein